MKSNNLKSYITWAMVRFMKYIKKRIKILGVEEKSEILGYVNLQKQHFLKLHKI